MAKRKQTPDVLAEILNGGAPDIVLDAPVTSLPSKAPKAAVKADSKTTPKPAAKAAPKPAEPKPHTWEYQVVTFQDYRGWRPRYINGKELRDWTSGPLLHEYLNDTGAEGWELAAASAGERLYGSGDSHQLYFKRPA